MKLSEIFMIAVALGLGIFLGISAGSFSVNFSGNGILKLSQKNTTTETISQKSYGDVRVPIVVYHSVRPYIPNESAYQDRFDITPELLTEHLKFLKENNFTTITFSQLADYFENGMALPEKPVILSFDDSWENQYVYAFPLLKEFTMSGTFFVFTNSLDKKHHLTWDQVKEMQKSGMEIGSHTKTHPFLDDIKDPELLKKEVTDSKKILESELGVKIISFAYPFGEHATSSVKAVKNAGYRIARSLRRGVVQSEDDKFILRAFLATDNFQDFVRMMTK